MEKFDSFRTNVMDFADDAKVKAESLMSRAKLQQLLDEKEEDRKLKKILLVVLAVIGAVAAVAAIAYAVYQFVAPDYLEDYDDYDDDFGAAEDEDADEDVVPED